MSGPHGAAQMTELDKPGCGLARCRVLADAAVGDEAREPSCASVRKGRSSGYACGVGVLERAARSERQLRIARWRCRHDAGAAGAASALSIDDDQACYIIPSAV